MQAVHAVQYCDNLNGMPQHAIISRVLLLLVNLGALVQASNAQTMVLENNALRCELNSASGSVSVIDRQTGAVWDLGRPHLVFADQQVAPVKPSGHIRRSGDTLSYAAEPSLEFRIQITSNPASVVYSFSGPLVSFVGPEIQEVQLVRNSLPVGAGENGYYAVPNRMGVMVSAGTPDAYSYRLPAYQTWGPGYSMAMLGAVKNGSAMLVSWDAPYTDLIVSHTAQPRQLTAGLALRENARTVRFQPLGRGGYVEIAKAYRPIARQRGWLKPMSERLRENPGLEKLIGAADVKPFTFIRHVARDKQSSDKLEINFTFDEAAAVAEHMRRDLGMDRAMLILAGWIRRGYDNQHPDILPAAPELGGNAALADCARRAKALGWLFGLHDNYQDLYPDAPSWSEDYLIHNADGSLMKGGAWAGGQCYIICSRKGLELAMRPQNLPKLRELFAPSAYFIDCTTANRLKNCYDPKHPTTKVDDIRYRQELADFARRQFGVFGSEEGFEWAVPHAEYFEGLLSHKTGANMPSVKNGLVIPLFELVYGDSIAIYAHQGDRAAPDNPSYILDHVLYAEMPVYEFGNHRYWTDASQDFKPAGGAGDRLIFTRGSGAGVTDRFIRNTYEVLSPLNRVTAVLPMTDHRFVTPGREVESTRFGDDVDITVNYGSAPFTTGDTVLPRYGFLVSSPKLVAFCATRFLGVAYSEPTLFVLRSLDGQALDRSARVRVYRGFGGKQVAWRGGKVDVETERILSK